MNYKIWYDEEAGAAHLKLFKMVTADDVDGFIPRADELLKGKANKFVLVDLGDNPPGVLDKAARKAIRSYAEKFKFDKIAMYGAKPVLRMVGKIAVASLGKADITKFFETKDEAVAWFNGE